MPTRWDDLNERQRAYLQALYDADLIDEILEEAAGGGRSSQPSPEQRWQMYGPLPYPTMLYNTLKEANLVDPSTGATWKALEDRKLCQTRTVSDTFDNPLLEVKITPLGRRLVRMVIREQQPKPLPKQRPKSIPKGQLRERQWAALVRLHQAGERGIDSDTLQRCKAGFDWWNTLRRLEEYKPHPLIAEFKPVGSTYRYRITQAGVSFYHEYWAKYRELYPDVAAPKPD